MFAFLAADFLTLISSLIGQKNPASHWRPRFPAVFCFLPPTDHSFIQKINVGKEASFLLNVTTEKLRKRRFVGSLKNSRRIIAFEDVSTTYATLL